MAHDFNNILSIIMGLSELLMVTTRDAKVKKDMQLILEQTLRGQNLTKNLIVFAKDQEIKQQYFDINEKIDLVLSLMKKDLSTIDITLQKKADVPELLADSGMIEHALVNLIQNSIHALSQTKQPKIFITTFSDETNVTMTIKDNGCGIPEDHLDDIFDPSFTLKGSMDQLGVYSSDIKGTGYGMANVKKYIEMHRGETTVESEVNKGTTVTISLPIIKKQLSQEEQAEIQEAKTYSGKRILLVEDELPISDIQCRILTAPPCSHMVDAALNGQAAMDLFDKNQYDMVSLDYMLPGKINGMDVYRYIRKTNTDIPILFISGNIEFLESIVALKENDRNIDHISKPSQNRDYVLHINRLLSLVFDTL